MSSIQARNINHPEHRENLNAEKYRIMRSAILAVLPASDWMSFSDMEVELQAYLADQEVPQSLFPKPGSVRWYAKAVQLDLEARGEIERQAKRSPLRLRRCL